jgi:hypothetical protein
MASAPPAAAAAEPAAAEPTAADVTTPVAPSASSGWLEDVCVGALAGGVNAPTAAVVKLACVALLAPQLVLLRVALHKGHAVGHVCALLALTVALLAAVSWCAACATAVLGSARACAALSRSAWGAEEAHCAPCCARAPARRFIAQLGLVSAEAQRSELGLDAVAGSAPPATGEADAAAAAAAPEAEDAKKER